jgi:dephospho-CoA kinase
MQRNELSREEAVARLAAQLPQERKVELADHVIDNSGSLEQTRARVEEVWSSLQEER